MRPSYNDDIIKKMKISLIAEMKKMKKSAMNFLISIIDIF